jgi:hypothetical protein
MATSKNRINAYVDDISDQAFKEWCVTNACTASKGVELLIKQCLLGVAQNQATGNVPIADNVVTKEALDIAIAEVETKFKNQLGDFRSEVADTAITDGTMRSAINPLVERIDSLENELKKDEPLG